MAPNTQSTGYRAKLAAEKKKGDEAKLARARNPYLMSNEPLMGGDIKGGFMPGDFGGTGRGSSGSSLTDKGFIDDRGIPGGGTDPAGFGDPKGAEYFAQSIARGGGNAAGGIFDMINMLPNAALQSGYDIFTGHPENAPQFGSVSQAIRNEAANRTGADIVGDEEVTPGMRLAGAGAELGTSVAADPFNYLGAMGGASRAAKPIEKAVEAKAPLVAANDAAPLPTRSTGFPEAAVDEGIGNRRFESRKLQAKGQTEPEDTFDPYAVRKPEKGELEQILAGTTNKGGIEPVPAEAAPPRAVTDDGKIPYPEHERSGIFDYGAEFPERDLGIQRFEPKKVPERTTNLLARQDVKDQMAAGIERGSNFKDWYNTAPIRKFFQDEFGDNRGLELFDRWMDANSATSPRSDVGTNVRNASYWYGKTFREPGQNEALTIDDLPEKPPNPYGHLAQLLHRGNIAKTLLPGGAGYDFKQNAKPIAYGGALKGDLSRVPVDAHAYKAPAILGEDPNFLSTSFKPEKDVPTQNIRAMLERGDISMEDAVNRPAWWESRPKPTEYDIFEKYWSELGSDFGMRPGEVQPSGWTGLGERTGLESDPTKKYMDFTEERILKTARKYGMDPIEVFRLAIRGKMPLVEADVSDVPGYSTTG
jgi:hypothetical protein